MPLRMRLTKHSSPRASAISVRSEEHTSELQSQSNLVCRLLLEKKKTPYQPSKVIAAGEPAYLVAYMFVNPSASIPDRFSAPRTVELVGRHRRVVPRCGGGARLS